MQTLRENGSGKRYFGRGGVKIALLRLLADEPMHGYQIMKTLEEQSGGLYIPSAGSIYPNLQALEERGFVSVQVEEGGKKIYSITGQGRSALKLLQGKPKRCGEGGTALEAEAFRNEKIRRKLGLSSETFDLLRLVARAEQEASASKELSNKLQRLLTDQLRQLSDLLGEHSKAVGAATPLGNT